MARDRSLASLARVPWAPTMGPGSHSARARERSERSRWHMGPLVQIRRIPQGSGATERKVLKCTFVVFVVYTFRKHLKNRIQSRNCVLQMVLLSFSLRFCSVFKMHYKTRLKVKSLPKKRDSLHTCSNEKRFFEINFEKTTVARTRVQSALALGTFTAVL